MCEDISNSHFIMHPVLPPSSSSLYSFLNNRFRWCVNCYLTILQIVPFLLRHCLMLPCLFFTTHLSPLSFGNISLGHPTLFLSPQASLEHSLKLWSPAPEIMPQRWPGLLPTQESSRLASSTYWFTNESNFLRRQQEATFPV